MVKVTPPIDPELRAKLSMPIPGITLPNQPLAKAVQDISAIGNLSVSFDTDALEELGVSLHDPISIDVANTTVAKVLKEIAAKRKLMPVIENGQVLLDQPGRAPRSPADGVGPRCRSNRRQRPSRGRIGRPGTKARRARVVAGQRRTWDRGSNADALRISQTGRVHCQIAVFCENLRIARGVDTKKPFPATRTARAKAVLGRIVTVHAGVREPLSKILSEQFEPVSGGGEILIDRPVLAAICASDATVAWLQVGTLPLGEALTKLLEPLGLTWQAVNAETLQITTQKAAAADGVGVLFRGQVVGRQAPSGVDRAH